MACVWRSVPLDESSACQNLTRPQFPCETFTVEACNFEEIMVNIRISCCIGLKLVMYMVV